nr:hypothetical protein [Mucilaginibacter sp. L294]
MNEEKSKRTNLKSRIIRALIISFAFFILAFFYYHIDKLTPWWFLIIAMLTIAILFIIIVVNVIKQTIFIIKQRKSLTVMCFLPLLIYLSVVLAPFGSSEDFESNVKFRACYEGTQNQAYINFREDKTFELHWTGAFFYNEWFTGKWEQKGNNLTLKYDNKVVDVLGHRLLIDSGYLIPRDKEVIVREHGFKRFYLGYCKNEN